MSAGIFLIAILGCGEAEAPCQTVRTLETRYESRAACTAATDAAAMRHSDVDFPVVVAECVAAGGPAKPAKADEVRRPGPGRADVRVSPLGS
jgi:hypothetical protein